MSTAWAPPPPPPQTHPQHPSQTQSSLNDDLIEYSVKRWAPFACRFRLAIVACSTEDVLHEYAHRLSKPIAELVERYGAIRNQRRRHRPKRGLSLIWDVSRNRPRVLFYWSSGRKHFWCCDPLQLCPARFLGDPTLPADANVEEMVDYSLNVLSHFDPSPIIEGAVRPAPRLSLVPLYDDDDESSASEETYQPLANSPIISRTPSSSVLDDDDEDDPIIPYRLAADDDESSDIRLSASAAGSLRPPLAGSDPGPPLTPRLPKSQDLDEILDQSDVNAIIASMQESRSLTGNDIIRTVETVRHRSIFSPRAVMFSPLVPTNITFPANVRPIPAEFEMPSPGSFAFSVPRPPPSPPPPTLPPMIVTADAGTKSDPLPTFSHESMVVAPTQDPVAMLPTMGEEEDELVATGSPLSVDNDDDDMSLSDLHLQQLSAQTASPLAIWRQLFPHALHFCGKTTAPFGARHEFQTYIRFDSDHDPNGCPRHVVALAMSVLAPGVLVQWVYKQSLLEAPFVAIADEQYALVPFSDGRGVFLCMNDSAWMEFGLAALLETKRRKPVLTGPIETSIAAWLSICALYLQGDDDDAVSHTIERFHDDIIDALTQEDTLPDNSVMMHSLPLVPLSSDQGVADERPPLSEDATTTEDKSEEPLPSMEQSASVPRGQKRPFNRLPMSCEQQQQQRQHRSSLDVSERASDGQKPSERRPLGDVSNQILAESDATERQSSESKTVTAAASAGDDFSGLSGSMDKELSSSRAPGVVQTQEQTQTVDFLLENIAEI